MQIVSGFESWQTDCADQCSLADLLLHRHVADKLSNELSYPNTSCCFCSLSSKLVLSLIAGALLTLTVSATLQNAVFSILLSHDWLLLLGAIQHCLKSPCRYRMTLIRHKSLGKRACIEHCEGNSFCIYLDLACMTQYIMLLNFCLFNFFFASFCWITRWCDGFTYISAARHLSSNFSFSCRMALLTFPLTTTLLYCLICWPVLCAARGIRLAKRR